MALVTPHPNPVHHRISLCDSDGKSTNSHSTKVLVVFTSRTPLSAGHSIHPPETSGDPFAVNHWPEAMNVKLEFIKGVMHITPAETPASPATEQTLHMVVPNLESFLYDYDYLRTSVADGPLKSFCFRRLTYLRSKFSLHELLNEGREACEQKGVSHRDFYNIRKVS